MKKYFFLLTLCFFVPLFGASAADLYFTSDRTAYGTNDTFAVNIKIDLLKDEECINVVEASIGFDRDYLELVDFGTGDSILSLWLEKPGSGDAPQINHDERIKFSGGIPGGYCGKIAGDTGDSNILGKLVFKVKPRVALNNDKKAKIFFLPETQILLNDGQGSAANINKGDFSVGITAVQPVRTEEWENLKTSDNIPPESFVIEILKNPGVYNDKYYASWTTMDKQTGVDHFEIKESDELRKSNSSSWIGYLVGLFGEDEDAGWRTVSSPYVLEDQTLSKLIQIKAVDKAGNERVSEYFQKSNKNGSKSAGYIGFFVISLVVIIIFVIIKSLKSKKKI